MNKKLMLIGLTFTIISCGGGGGGGNSPAPVKQNNLVENTQPTIIPKKNENNKKQEDKKEEKINIKEELKTENKKPEKSKRIESTTKSPKPVTGKGKGVKIGILDSDFTSREKMTPAFYEKMISYGEVLDTEFGNRIVDYNNKDALLKNVDDHKYTEKQKDILDSHGLIVASIAAGKNQKDAASLSEVHTVSIKYGDGLKIPLEVYEKMKNNGVMIYNQSFGSSGVLISEVLNDEPAIHFKEYFRIKDKIEQFELNKKGQEYIDFYKKAVEDGALFIWAAGNTEDEGKRTLNDVTVEAGLPVKLEELKKGWLSVVGVNENKKDYSPHLAWAGSAAYWSVSASGECTILPDCRIHGSSFAAPKVLALAAKIKEKYPWMDGHEIQQTILTTANDIGDLGVDTKYGWGYINIEKALKGPAKFDNLLLLRTSAVKNGLKNGQFNANIKDDETYIFENDIDGDAGLLKKGIGTLVLKGKSTYKGNTNVESGILEIYKENTSNFFVGEEGKLILHPEARIGIIKARNEDELYKGIPFGKKNVENKGVVETRGKGARISGDYIAYSGSQTLAEIGSSLFVDGNTTLNKGSKAKLFSNDQYFSYNVENFEIIKSNNEINGNFTQVDGPELLNINSKVENNKVLLEISRKNTVSYVNDLNDSDKMRKDTAENIEKIFEETDKKIENKNFNKEFLSNLINLQNNATNETIGKILDSLSGQIHGSSQALTFKQSEVINMSLTDRLTSLSINDVNKFGIWINNIGSNGKILQKGYAKGKMSLKGIQLGFDKKINDLIILGSSFHFSDGNVKFDRFGGKSDSKNFGVSIYGKYKNNQKPYYFQGRIGIGKVKTNVEREIIMPKSEINIVSSEHTDKIYSGYAEVGYNFKIDDFSLNPFTSLSSETLKRGSFKEENSELALKSDSEKYKQNSIYLGLKGEKIFDLNKNKTLKIFSQGIYRKSLNNEDLSFDANYIGLDNLKINVKGIGLPKESVIFGVGATLKFRNSLEIFANYDKNIDIKRGENYIFTTGFRVEF